MPSVSRRGFIGALLAAAAGAALDPEKLLWVPNQKKIFTPPPGGWRDVYTTHERISIRYLKPYELNSSVFPSRFDVLYGVSKLKPQFVGQWSSAEHEERRADGRPMLAFRKDAFTFACADLPNRVDALSELKRYWQRS